MYIVLGSCRVLVTMSYSKYNCLNTCQLLNNVIEIRIKCKDDNIGHEYDYNKIEENILYIVILGIKLKE